MNNVSNIAALLQTTFGYKELGPLITNLWGVAFTIGAAAAFLYTVIGAVNWITGGGDKAKVEEAKNRITQGMLGLAILAVTWAVALLVQRFLGLNILLGGSNGGGGGGGQPSAFCQANPSKCCNSWADPGSTHCRNQDCGFYFCDNGTWKGPNGFEPKCKAEPAKGCYGVNQGNF